MLACNSALLRFLGGLVLAALIASPATSADAGTRLAQTVENIEERLDARVGLLIRDSGTGWSWGHRADERFLMNSTAKVPLCGAVLAQVDKGAMRLTDGLDVRAEDMVEYAPVTELRIGDTMQVGELCFAALDMSDNAAANILIDHLGGPQEVTAFMRQIGDDVSRLDRREPDLNRFETGDPRDTTSPAAVVDTLERLLVGDALSPSSRAQLTEWMTPGGVTGALLRAFTPDSWRVADKSGSGSVTRNIVGMIAPPQGGPYFVAIYLSEAEADFDTRNAAVVAISAAVVELIASR